MSRNELIWEMAEIIGLIYEKENDNSNITNVVERMNGTISEEFDTSQYSDGSIEKVLEKDIMFRINLYNNNSTLQRKNFTIAHELGHLFLHMGFGTKEWYKVENGTRYYRSGLDDEEKEANQFAAAFLMPKKEITEKIQEIQKDLNIVKNETFKTESNKIEIEKFVILFFSFDITNSSKYKTIDYLYWPVIIHHILKRIEEEVVIKFSGEAQLWRILGDEIIFVKKVASVEEMAKIVEKINKIKNNIIGEIQKT